MAGSWITAWSKILNVISCLIAYTAWEKSPTNNCAKVLSQAPLSTNAFDIESISVPFIGCPVVSTISLNLPFKSTPPKNPVTLYPLSSTFVIASEIDLYKLFEPGVIVAPVFKAEVNKSALNPVGLSIPVNTAWSNFLPIASWILGFTSPQIS